MALHWVMRVTYAFSTALISVFPHVGQGDAYAALIGTTLRHLGDRDPAAMAQIAAALSATGVPASSVPERIAASMEAVFRSLGMATRLSGLGIERGRLPQVLEISL